VAAEPWLAVALALQRCWWCPGARRSCLPCGAHLRLSPVEWVGISSAGLTGRLACTCVDRMAACADDRPPEFDDAATKLLKEAPPPPPQVKGDGSSDDDMPPIMEIDNRRKMTYAEDSSSDDDE
jgi:hypothetical protein